MKCKPAISGNNLLCIFFLFIYFAENCSAAPSSESEKDQLYCFHVWRPSIYLQPEQIPVVLMGAREEKSSLHAERVYVCILCHVSHLEQKTYPRMKGFVTERHIVSLDKVRYGQNTKYTLSIKYSSL